MRGIVLLLALGRSAAQTCTAEGGSAIPQGVTLDFQESEGIASNLGGLGPNPADPPQLRYKDLGYDYYQNVGFDLVITNLTYYRPNEAIRNLYTNLGSFGQINLADDEDCTFRYQFVKTNTVDTYVSVEQPFRFCLFDFDTGERIVTACGGKSDGEYGGV